ncbi:hypothetical protein A8924_3546 [Saccharopolyspora erythraea NRRL 2338]|uniref:Uncharacterized protein n=1 Tax=Saccharopolyspora erythraea (strain ATCC 11635 / DSM 40517 / JCM 4748 / NBRC 13426 / NCIMB 8594 / NRRL 2338) TaxID=405948 RepID=A4FEF7_SACEN|nr:hypothetical protein A8924_3546 [Saccharopolyspora erythraea NRRL 2338]CAM02432.1 hypothetical protein SACE_3155 [Saccharopolyspora erythraea NRRL 2338]
MLPSPTPPPGPTPPPDPRPDVDIEIEQNDSHNLVSVHDVLSGNEVANVAAAGNTVGDVEEFEPSAASVPGDLSGLGLEPGEIAADLAEHLPTDDLTGALPVEDVAGTLPAPADLPVVGDVADQVAGHADLPLDLL